MSARWHPGQLLWIGFEGPEIPPAVADLVAAGRVGGVILFARNLPRRVVEEDIRGAREGPPSRSSERTSPVNPDERAARGGGALAPSVVDVPATEVDPAGLRRLVRALRDLAPADAPLGVAVDQEGGRVQRLRRPWTEWPPMATIGASDDVVRAREVGGAIARELRDVGFTLDFAPVVDVATNPDNPVIGDRAFSHDPARVTAHARAFTLAMQREGIAACAKHFPGHGDTRVDSHLDLPVLDHDRERLDRVELAPFRGVIDAGIAAIMSAHVSFPRLDAARPATLSPEVMGILRGELAFDGLVFTDDLEMGAVAKHFSVEARTLGPLRAGCDVLLACRSLDLQLEMLRVLERAPDDVVERALVRLNAFKEKWSAAATVPSGPPAGPPYPAHEALATKLRS
jgi:beta-N-acetylhexosaminidase